MIKRKEIIQLMLLEFDKQFFFLVPEAENVQSAPILTKL